MKTAAVFMARLPTNLHAVIRPCWIIMGPTEYHDIAAQTITETPPCRFFTVGTKHSGL
jgi:hypothetical protein